MTNQIKLSARPLYKALVICLLLTGLFSFKSRPALRNAFQINKSSELSINGSSNVTDFSCDCQEDFEKQYFVLNSDVSRKLVQFQNTALKLTTKKLHCGHKGINKDLYEALKADRYPYISISLHKVEQQSGAMFTSNGEGWTQLKAYATITIANVSKKIMLEVQARRLSDNKFQFVSSKELLMTDFGIDPPRPMLGLIKVHDKISINLDLNVTILEE